MRAILSLILFSLMLFLSGCTTTGETILITGDKNISQDYNGAVFNDINQTINGLAHLYAGANAVVSCTGSDGNGSCIVSVNDANLLLNYYTEAESNALFVKIADLNGNILSVITNLDLNNSLDYIKALPSIVSHARAGSNMTIVCDGSDQNGSCTFSSTGGGGSGSVYTGILPIIVDNDANTIDFNSAYYNNQWRQEVDGGFANTSYLTSQEIEGGFANSTYTSTQIIDGGGA